MGKSRKEKDFFCVLLLSLPARGAWIEIDAIKRKTSYYYVAPRKGSVD